MSEARSRYEFGFERVLADATISPYEVRQAPSGKAGFLDSNTPVTSGNYFFLKTFGTQSIAKTTGIVLLKGGRVYWDHSANAATFRKVNDRDFYVGRVAEDASSAQTEVLVIFNEDPQPKIDLFRDGYLTAPVGTQVLGGFLPPQNRGGSLFFELTATNEAQKLDALSIDGFLDDANAIAEFVFRVPSDGAGTVVDVSLGLASGTHAADASSIAQRLFVHLDANVTTINFESADGVSVAVPITSSATTYTEGSAVANRVEVWFDWRDPADVQIYVNGVNVLPASVFDVDDYAGQWFLLAHIEKTISADTYQLSLDRAEVRTAEQ